MTFSLLIIRIKCFFGYHLWDERSEGVKCLRGGCWRSYDAIDWGDPRIKRIAYRRNSHRAYLGK